MREEEQYKAIIMNKLGLSQLMCSRLCHDLITPMGAISSGLEILSDCDEKDRNQILEILRNSSETANSRLVFYRAAFGASKSGPLVTASGTHQLLEGFLRPLKISLEWDIDSATESSTFDLALWGKMLLNLVLVAVETAPYGGKIKLMNQKRPEELDLHLTLSGNLLAMKTDVIRVLEGKGSMDELTPHTIHAFVAMELLRQLGLYLSFTQKESKILEMQVTNEASTNNLHASLF
jgi:histidine phosphotransferase ChpT